MSHIFNEINGGPGAIRTPDPQIRSLTKRLRNQGPLKWAWAASPPYPHLSGHTSFTFGLSPASYRCRVPSGQTK